MIKVAVNCGHTFTGVGQGAIFNNFRESEITRAVGYELIDILERKGHIAYNATIDKATSQNAYLKQSVNKVNQSNVDLAISLHCNASKEHKGNGVEIYTWNGARHKEALNILDKYEDMGFKNRGIKQGNNLYFIKNTKPKSLLVEMFFLDNVKDRNLYMELGHKQLARMIYYAIAS